MRTALPPPPRRKTTHFHALRYTTFLKLGGLALHSGQVDGIDVWPYIKGSMSTSPRTSVVLSTYTPYAVGAVDAIIDGHFKMIVGRPNCAAFPSKTYPTEAENTCEYYCVNHCDACAQAEIFASEELLSMEEVLAAAEEAEISLLSNSTADIELRSHRGSSGGRHGGRHDTSASTRSGKTKGRGHKDGDDKNGGGLNISSDGTTTRSSADKSCTNSHLDDLWLFDLSSDPTEKVNIAKKDPAKVAELKGLLSKFYHKHYADPDHDSDVKAKCEAYVKAHDGFLGPFLS